MSEAIQDAAVPDDGDLAAAEYVIGLLTADEARTVEARAIADPSVARSILRWQGHLSSLARQVRPVTAPPQVWQRLSAAVMPAELPVLDLAPFPQAPPPPAPLVNRPRRQWPWGSASAWRGGLVGGISGAALAVAVGVALIGPKLWTSPPGVAALVAAGDAEPAYQVMLMRNGVADIIALNPNYPNDGALQLWTLDGATPVSLGLLPRQGRYRIERRLVPGAKLLISREPRGGSPDAGPSGPVVYSGNLIKG